MSDAMAGCSSSHTVQGESSSVPAKIRDEVFSNDVVWRLLGKHLNIGDLKDCRLVSKGFNHKVLEATDFKSRSKIELNPVNLRAHVFGKTEESWKNIRLKLPERSRDPLTALLGPFSRCSEKVSSKLVEEDWFYPHLFEVEEFSMLGDESHGDCPLRLNQVLESAKKLKKLCLNQEFLNNRTELPDSERIEATLRNLRELELVGFSTSEFPQSWKSYFAGALKSLRVLRTDGDPLEGRIYRADAEYLNPQDQKFIRDIVESSRSTLTSLQLHYAKLWLWSSGNEDNILAESEFPLLKSVKICLNEEKASHVATFLGKHPLLEDVDLTVYSRCPVDLIQLIEGRKGYLKSLCLKTGGFEMNDANMWNFLRPLVNLEAFSLAWLPNSASVPLNFNICDAVLRNLPPTVRSIRLEGVPSPSGHEHQLNPESLSMLNPAVLTELSLSRCGGIDDAGMEIVCKALLRLRKLEITHADEHLTDRGFLGPSTPEQDGSIYSLSNLIGLRSLTLSQCEGITKETLLHGVKFKELRFLDISNNRRISGKTIIGEVLAQNPSLEVLRTSERFYEGINGLRKMCPRLAHLIEVPILLEDSSDDDSHYGRFGYDHSSQDEYDYPDEYYDQHDYYDSDGRGYYLD